MRTRTTVYLDPALHRALKIKAAETGRTLSDLLNEFVRQGLSEDLEDLAAVAEREEEETLPFEEALRELKARGLI